MIRKRGGAHEEVKREGGDVADFLPGGKNAQRNPKVQQGAAEPAPLPGRPFPP